MTQTNASKSPSYRLRTLRPRRSSVSGKKDECTVDKSDKKDITESGEEIELVHTVTEPIMDVIEIVDSSQDESPAKTGTDLVPTNLLDTQDSVFLNTQLLKACEKNYETSVLPQSLPTSTRSAPQQSNDKLLPQSKNKPKMLLNKAKKVKAGIQDGIVMLRRLTTQQIRSRQSVRKAKILVQSKSTEQNKFLLLKSIPNGTQYAFLNYIDIKEINSKIVLNGWDYKPSGLPFEVRQRENKLKAVLRFSFNGFHEITLNGKSMKRILKLNVKEWSAVQGILDTLGNEFQYSNSKRCQPTHANILYDALYYLFKTQSTFTNAVIEYRDQQHNEVNAVSSKFACIPKLVNDKPKDLSKAIDTFALHSMSNWRKFAENRIIATAECDN